MRVAVLTIDQRGSTQDAATDRVPATLVALAASVAHAAPVRAHGR